jgi:hypothetical protein
VDDGQVLGSAIGSVAHLLAELIENGLSFSPPDTEVEVQGRRLPDGYLIAVTDQGMGMTPAEIRDANARLQGEEDFVAAPSKYLGHHVVGKLAREISVMVELIPSPVTGITARVLLPEALLTPLRAVGQRPGRGSPAIGGSASPTPALAGPMPGPMARPITGPITGPIPSPHPGSAAGSASGPHPGPLPGPMPSPFAGPGGPLLTTRNGLRKRTPRARPGTSRVIDLDAVAEYSVPEYSVPDDDGPVTAGFSAFREGLARGEGARPGGPRPDDSHAEAKDTE